MKVCTFTNLTAAAVLGATLGFSACNASTIQTTAVDNPKDNAPPPAPATTPDDDTAAPATDTAASPADSAAAPAAGDEGGGDDRTAQIAAVIKDNRKPFRACYDKAQKQIPSLQGNMTLHFVLDGMGKVKSAELNLERSDLKSPKVVDCALKVLKAMKFPPHPKGMESTVNYPFNFRPH